MSRNICITAVEGNTGFLIAELLLTDENFSKEFSSITGLTMNAEHPRCKDLATLGAKIISYQPGRVRDVSSTLRHTNADTICLVPPAHVDKVDITGELIEATKKAGVRNALLLSSAGCDLAETSKQPGLREFVDLESRFLACKCEPETAGESLVIIRAGFYAENLLRYAPKAQEDGILPLPIGRRHKFAPVSLGDVALLAAHVLIGKGPHGFSDQHRGQLMTLTGPMLLDGEEIVRLAGEALGVDLKFEDISEQEAHRVLRTNGGENAEVQFLLDYFSLVREGKTNYISTTAFHDVTGDHPQEAPEFFKNYSAEFMPKKGAGNKRRKVDGSRT
ncbi:hypothetical protein ASPZODRAFT_801372 [Penicilliopsis zonata CBS 506.65]|uniref:NmrA-like domain-containing protein n=1 Tax=Penicilliopsis zonata CBS 506.65 TaxID=1073090 RepID=A0A1L9S9Z0_9EURO|nr:hypothetical protein ASPZODRAFT_801372 [Penicilliopsis zonata CBS 506.65]OJJ43959.1 hypothetical protein ASPZODRAFT_801372 [Penicilliopsis zonata CBS 506.65]